MKEKPIAFGEGRRLVGVLTQPDSARDGSPAVIIPNTGVDHRVGPNRLHVVLSRALAELGLPVLRMDLSGMGDSLPRLGGSVDSVADQRAALDELERLGIAKTFIVIGLCSGAHDAHLLTLADPRIVAGAYIDHYAYQTPRFKFNYWRERLLSPRRLMNVLRPLFQSKVQREKEAIIRGSDLQYFIKPPRDVFAQNLDEFMRRNLWLLFVYTGEVQAEYNYREQLLDGFPPLGAYQRLALSFTPGSDHTFTRAFMRRELIAIVSEWIGRVTEFAPVPPATMSAPGNPGAAAATQK